MATANQIPLHLPRRLDDVQRQTAGNVRLLIAQGDALASLKQLAHCLLACAFVNKLAFVGVCDISFFFLLKQYNQPFESVPHPNITLQFPSCVVFQLQNMSDY